MEENNTVIKKSTNIVLRKKKINDKFSLYLDIHHDGVRSKEYLKLYISDKKKLNDTDKETLLLAERILTRKTLEYQARYHGEPDFAPKHANFMEYLEKVIKNSKHLKPNSIKKINSLKLHLNKFHPHMLRFESINNAWIERFRSYLLFNLKRSSADRYFSELKTILNYAVRDNIIKFNPMGYIKRIGKDKSLPKFLTFEELEILNNTHMYNNELKRAFIFSCYTSLRHCDVKNLKWENIILHDGNYYINYEQQKTGSEEMTLLHPVAIKLLGNKKKHSSPVFSLPHPSVINRSLKRWAKRAGINKNIFFNMSRHTCGTLLHTYGVDIYTISKIMGHSDTRVTQIYAKVIDRKKEEGILKLPELK